MMIRSVVFASVCTALLAASAVGPVAAAADKPSATQSAEQGYKALASGNAKEAVARYSDAIESRNLGVNELARALLSRALAFQKLGQNREAIDDYSTAMRIDALSPRLRAIALYNRGLAQQKLGQPARAIDDFTNALFLDAGFAQAYYSRGDALRQSGQYLFALSDYEKALHYSHPETYLPYYGEALTYRSLNRTEQAQKALLLSLRANPQFQPAKDLLRQISGGESAPAARPKPVLSLAASEQQAAAVSGADDIVTGSLQPGQPDQVVVKAATPAAKRPPASLLPESIRQQAVSPSPAPRNAQVAKLATPTVTAPPKAQAPEPAPQPQSAEESPKQAPADTAQPQGWTVQLSSQRQPDAAWSVWKKLSNKYGSLLAGTDPLVYKADLGDRGIFYRLRVHRIDSRRAAKSLCHKLRSRGTACFVSHAG